MNQQTTPPPGREQATGAAALARLKPRQGSSKRASDAPAAEGADLALVRRALAQESTALIVLIERLTPVIRARVLRSLSPFGKGSSQQEVADFTQEVFAHLFANGGRALLAWQPSMGLSLEGFASLIAHRKVVSILRTRCRSPFAQLPEDPMLCDERPLERSRSLDSEIAGHQRCERLFELLAQRLSPRGLEICRRLFVELQSPQQVAQALVLTLDCVYQWRSRLSRLLREAAASLDTEPGRSQRPPNRSA